MAFDKKLRVVCTLVFCFTLSGQEHLAQGIARLIAAYPAHIKEVNENSLTWADGMCMSLGNSDSPRLLDDKLNNPTLADQLTQPVYISGELVQPPQDDPGRIRYEPFFKKMYGNSPQEVESHLTDIVWMPKIFENSACTLRVTTVNNIHEKIKCISDELEDLASVHPEYVIFLQNPGGTYNWRTIANTNRLSAHSFGMTLDINAHKSQYWQWDLKSENRPISEDEPLTYRNTIPWEIVAILEKHGFIWGGKWYHYDTMHFEYRPELMINP